MILPKYPWLAVSNSIEFSSDSMELSWGADLPKGWQSKFFSVCEKLAVLLRDYNAEDMFHIEQVKEKFGGIRIYYFLDDDIPASLPGKIEKILLELEDTKRICSECGKPATYISTGYILPYCSDCGHKINNAWNQRHKTSYDFNLRFRRLK